MFLVANVFTIFIALCKRKEGSNMLKKFKKIVAILFVVVLCSNTLTASAATSVTVVPTLAYSITGLPSSNAVQNFFIGSTYIYLTQKTSSGTVYLSRCNKSTGACLDYMTLNDFGHGESLEVCPYNGINYIYITAKSYVSGDDIWSTQISRFQYSAGSTLAYTAVPRIGYMNYANTNKTNFGTVKRFNFALSTDESVFIFRVQNTSNNIQFATYSFTDVNSLLDSVGADTANAASIASINTLTNSFSQSPNATNSPNGSFQGLELSSYDNIFTAGGLTTDPYPIITKMNSTGALVTTYNIPSWGGREIEGLFLYGDLYTTYKSGTYSTYIYKIIL
jgi:hypothetical protein